MLGVLRTISHLAYNLKSFLEIVTCPSFKYDFSGDFQSLLLYNLCLFFTHLISTVAGNLQANALELSKFLWSSSEENTGQNIDKGIETYKRQVRTYRRINFH